MNENFFDAVEKAYHRGEMSNPQFVEAKEYIEEINKKAIDKIREKKIEKVKQIEDEITH